MKNKILVLGATGNVGIPLVHMLKKANANFRIGIERDSKLPESMQSLKSVYVDYNESSTLENALTDIHTVFILIPDSPLMVSHATNIRNSILKNNVFRYIYLSGLGTKLAPGTWLSLKLAECEKMFTALGISGTIIRPNFFMQNFLNHYPPNSKNQISLPIKDGKINYIDVNDVAKIAFKLLADDELVGLKEVDLTGDYSYSMDEITSLFTDTLGKEYRYTPISFDESKQAMEKKKIPSWLINMLLQIYKKVQENCYAACTQDFKMITGRDPKSLKSFIENNKSHFNQMGIEINH